MLSQPSVQLYISFRLLHCTISHSIARAIAQPLINQRDCHMLFAVLLKPLTLPSSLTSSAIFLLRIISWISLLLLSFGWHFVSLALNVQETSFSSTGDIVLNQDQMISTSFSSATSLAQGQIGEKNKLSHLWS